MSDEGVIDKQSSAEVLGQGVIDIDELLRSYFKENNINWAKPTGGLPKAGGGQINCDFAYYVWGRNARGNRQLVGVFAGDFDEKGESEAIEKASFIPASELNVDEL